MREEIIMAKGRSLFLKIFGACALALLALLVITAALPPSPAKAAPSNLRGSGTFGDPYLVETPAELQLLSSEVNGGNDFYGMLIILMKDISMSGVTSWEPIGTESNPFKGTFDGSGHSVSGLTFSDGTRDFAGLFGQNAGTVTNLTLNASISGKDIVGGIAARNAGASLISNCTFSGSVNGQSNVGGIAGINEGKIDNCFNDAAVNCAERGGGIAGTTSWVISSCTNRGVIKGSTKIGGIAGVCEGGTVTGCLNDKYAGVTSESAGGDTYAGGIAGDAKGEILYCTNKAAVTSKGQCTGGIAGYGFALIISECVNEGSVNSGGSERTGGIAGAANASAGTRGSIANCTNRGAVSGGSKTGGIAGTVSYCNIENSVSSNAVSGNERTGGIAGELHSGAGVDSCTNTGKVTGSTYVGGLTGKQEHSGDVLNSINRGDVKGSGGYVGGITGSAEYNYAAGIGSSIIRYCTNSGDVEGNSHTGGIAGFSNANIGDCINRGDVDGGKYTAGIVGITNDGGDTLKDNVNEGNITGTNDVGGICGYQQSSAIVHCHNKGDVKGTQDVGGIIGFNRPIDVGCTIKYCINDGDVTATGPQDSETTLGGIVGYGNAVSVIECGNTGDIEGEGKNAGGIIGYAKGGSITDCYNRGAVYGYRYIGGIVGHARETVKVTRSYCFAPDDHPKYSGQDGIDCIYYEVGYYGYTGGLVGKLFNGDTVLTLKDNYWWCDCSDYALGWVTKFGILSGDGYDYFYYQKRFKDPSYFKGWDFKNVWVVKGDAPVNRRAQNIDPKGGIGGVGGAGGSGAAVVEYVTRVYITDLNEFKAFRDSVNNGESYRGVSVFLKSDIDLAGANWTPIGVESEKPFSGAFYGENHFIKGLKVDSSGNGGLFGYMNGGSVYDLWVYGSVKSSGYNVGGIAGYCSGSIERCTFVGDVTSAHIEGNVGGIAGGIGNTGMAGRVDDCLHVGNVSATGGIVGGVVGNKTFINFSMNNCLHIGSVTGGGNKVGGIVGSGNQMQNITNCFAAAGSSYAPFGSYYGAAPVGCGFLSADELISTEKFKSSGWSIDFDAGYTWGMGWEYPVQQQFSEYITLVPLNDKDDARVVWLPKTEMKVPAASYTRDGYAFDSWNTGRDGSGTKYVAGNAVPANAVLYGQWNTVDYTITYTDTGEVQHYNIESTDLLGTRQREHYAFDGWKVLNSDGNWTEGEIAAGGELLTGRFGNVRLGAEWSALPKYTITWKMDNGAVIDTTVVEDGVLPEHADAVKQGTDEYSYEFTGWTPDIAAAQGDAEYTATFREVKKSYTITWKNDDGTVIDTTTVEYGAVPAHDDAVKANTAEFTYEFAGWSPEVVQVAGDAEYTATFTSTRNSYTITWKNEDGTVIDTTTVEYGAVPVHEDAVKANTAEFTYEFAGWSPEPQAVVGEAAYTAVFLNTRNSYKVTWKNDDGTVIDTTTVEYGEVPEHEPPVKENTAEFTYTFAGWQPEVVSVTGEAVYTARFTAERNSYTVTWLDDDGSVIDTQTVEYGQIPSHADMTKNGDSYNTYEFAGWSPEIVAVTGEASYTAVYTATKNAYEVRDVDKLSWAKGSGETVTVTVIQTGAEDRSFEDFTGVEADGIVFEKDRDYTVTKGSTVVTFAPEALEKLEKGTYTLTFNFVGGNASVPLEIIEETHEPIPQTGDVNIALVLVFVLTGAAAIAFVIVRGKNRAAAAAKN